MNTNYAKKKLGTNNIKKTEREKIGREPTTGCLTDFS